MGKEIIGPEKPQPDETLATLANHLSDMNKLLVQDIQSRSWKVALRNGVLAGLGGVIGATLIVSLLIASLRWFKPVRGIGPTLERIAEALENK